MNIAQKTSWLNNDSSEGGFFPGKWSTWVLPFAFALTLALGPASALAAGPEVDLSFDAGSSVNHEVRALAPQPDGKVLIGGYFTTVHGANRGGVARLNADGSTDLSFLQGLPGTDGVVSGLARLSDGKVVVAGNFRKVNGVARMHVARLNPDGSLDTTFNTGSGPDAGVDCMIVQGDGRVVIGGEFSTVNGIARSQVARLNADGTLDVSFAPVIEGSGKRVWALALQSDGKILLGGWFGAVNGAPRGRLARLNADGTLDTSFLGGLAGADGAVHSLLRQPDGRVVVGGEFKMVNGIARGGIARLMPDGSVDPGFGNALAGTDGVVSAVLLSAGNRVVIGGAFGTVNGTPRLGLARLNDDGTLDGTFTSGSVGTGVGVQALALQVDGKLIVGGAFSEVNEAGPAYVARLNDDGSTDTTFSNGPSGPNGLVEAIALQSDGKVLAAGYFTAVSGSPFSYLARFNGDGALDGTFRTQGTGPNSVVHGLLVQADGQVLAHGHFTSVDGASRTGLARFQSDGALDPSFAPVIGPYTDGVRLMALQPGGKILIAGSFSSVNGSERHQVARLNSDGTLDAGFGPVVIAPGGGIAALAVQRDGKILLGGYFTSVNGAGPNLVRLNEDGTLDTSFRAGLEEGCQNLAVQPDGRILVVRTFDLLRLNADGSRDGSFAATINEAVHSIAFQPDGKILLGGRFMLVNNLQSWVLARLNPDGSSDPSFLAGPPWPDGLVRAIVTQGDGKLLACGGFCTFYGIPKAYVARLSLGLEPPSVTRDPSSQTAEAGKTVAFRAVTRGTEPFAYQWYGTGPIPGPGGTNATLLLRDVQFTDQGSYQVVITNCMGCVTSAPALLNVIAPSGARPVPELALFAEAGSAQHLEFNSAILPSGGWSELAAIIAETSPQLYFDLVDPGEPQRFYRLRQEGTPAGPARLSVRLVPAIPLAGALGSKVRVDYIEAIGPVDNWRTLATVTLTNSPQFHFDVTAAGQPERCYRVVLVP